MQELNVISGQQDTEAFSLGNGSQGGVLTRVETPAALTSTAMTIYVSVDGGATFKLSSGASITVAADRSYYIDPLYTRGGTHAKLKFGTAEGAARVIKIQTEYRRN